MTTIRYVAYKDVNKIDNEGNPLYTVKEVTGEFQVARAVASLLINRKKGFPRTIDFDDETQVITVNTEVTKTKDREKKVKEIPDFMD